MFFKKPLIVEAILQMFTILCIAAVVFALNDFDFFRRTTLRCKSNDVFLRTRHGDLAFYCQFLKKHPFTGFSEGQQLLYPEYFRELAKKYDYSARYLFGLFWPPIFEICLYPVKVQGRNYEYRISPKYLQQLLSREYYIAEYKNKTFLAPKSLPYHAKDWAIFTAKKDNNEYIFTLPFSEGVSLSEGN